MERTPYLRFDLARVRENARRFQRLCERHWAGRWRAFYAAKANPDPRVLKVLAAEGFGFEVMTATQLGDVAATGREVIVSGFHKSAALWEMAPSRARYLVIEGVHELSRLLDLRHPVDIVLRVKLGPERKIGCALSEVAELADTVKARPGINIIGLHYHAGWNVRDDGEIRTYLGYLLESAALLRKHGVAPRVLNLGGSFCEDGADPSQLEKRLNLYAETLQGLDVEVHLEPGRYLVGDAGDLITRIVHVDEKRRRLHVDTCAYGYKLTAGTPQATLLDSASESSQWTVFGFWPAEGDQCVLELQGRPSLGGCMVLKNMGAYTWDMPFQFEPDRGLRTEYIGEKK